MRDEEARARLAQLEGQGQAQGLSVDEWREAAGLWRQLGDPRRAEVCQAQAIARSQAQAPLMPPPPSRPSPGAGKLVLVVVLFGFGLMATFGVVALAVARSAGQRRHLSNPSPAPVMRDSSPPAPAPAPATANPAPNTAAPSGSALPSRVRAKDGMPQVLIPAGEFWMGSADGDKQAKSDEQPRKKVYVGAFWMDGHTITNEQYGKFLRETGYKASEKWGSWSGGTSAQVPAVWVSWEDASAYARWVGASLPTEAQWEKAARGGQEGLQYPWGNEPSPADANGDWAGKYGSRDSDDAKHTLPVGSLRPNGYGLFDMVGNVWQWCRDWYSDEWYDDMPSRDPENTSKGRERVMRGGCWDSTAKNLRVAARHSHSPGFRMSSVGFRCAEAP
jgi:formylglycine-generating enzyme required for sulfatase activity